MTDSEITLDELIVGFHVDDVSIPLAMFVAEELNYALVHHVNLNGLGWLSADGECGCLVATAARRVGLDVTSETNFWTMPLKLSAKVGIEHDLLAGVAAGFTVDKSDELAEAPDDVSYVTMLVWKYGFARVLGSRALLLFREHGGHLLCDKDDDDA